MDKDILKGLKISIGFFLGCFILFGIVYAVGFHTANEILGGTFTGDYTFNGTIFFNDGSNLTSAPKNNLKIISGSINNDGSINSGADFTVTKLGTGQYRINFNSPFISRPSVIATHRSGSSTARMTLIGNSINTTSALLYILTADGLSFVDDGGIEFIISGD